jgi:hypothetical protein
VVDLDEFFRVAGVIILIDRSTLELVGRGDLPNPGARARNAPLPNGLAASAAGGRRPCPEASSIANDVVNVNRITTILLLPAALSYLSTSVVIGQMSIAADRRSFFTLSAHHPIGRLVSNGGLAPLVSSRRFCCDNPACRFSPLLGQSDEWSVLGNHAPN